MALPPTELTKAACALVSAGAHRILVEKPGGVDVAEIEGAASVVGRTDTEVYVAYNRRFYASVTAARAMIAGTVFVHGQAGPGAGAWSKRGAVIVLGDIAVPETYSHACDYRPPMIPGLFRYLQRQYQFQIQEQYVTGVYRRWVGDLADVGKGEILRWVGA